MKWRKKLFWLMVALQILFILSLSTYLSFNEIQKKGADFSVSEFGSVVGIYLLFSTLVSSPIWLVYFLNVFLIKRFIEKK
jgi:hypothetical protein